MEVCFFSVVYPAVEPFLEDFFKSLEKQTTDGFSLVLVNDGIGRIDRFVDGINPARVTVLESGSSPAENRMIGIRHAIAVGSKYLVFGDSDDYFSANRVEGSIEFLDEGWDVVVNDLTTVESVGGIIESNYLSKRIGHGTEIEFAFIRQKNLFGLSNTAVRVSSLAALEIPDDLIAVDWYLFSVMLLNGSRASFNGKASTFYRQHGANTIGLGALEEAGIAGQLDAKTRHYKAMSRVSDQYEDWPRYRQTLECLQRCPERISEYLNFLRKQEREYPLWWENVLPWEERHEV